MIFRTDLAIEAKESVTRPFQGITQSEEQHGSCRITRIRVEEPEAARQLNKEIGTYVTLEMPPISDTVDLEDECQELLRKEIAKLLPEEGLVLVAGLGNRQITPDALGPQTTGMVLATRHIKGELARVTGLTGLRGAAVIAPGVLGNTGLETAEFLQGICRQLKPCAIVVIDALAARSLARLGCTVQLSDTGISPGEGVGNRRPRINEETMGVPVVSIGVPTVVDVETLALDLFGGDRLKTEQSGEKLTPRGARMVVTPREIDLLVARAARMLAMGINRALNPSLSVEDLTMLTAQ
ncbi:GPR endopeptidase [Clostridium minihomine]|uniref:GPR endopeptidase n=1 Tax=Clostridium minihomine TaxID=2045012 RepID=UPI000C79067F|nr:GPR endopeptidase [Clostridium minihomine]